MGQMSAIAADAALHADEPNPREFIGANGPPEAPEPTPFEAIRVRIEDLLIEAHNWADGTTVETQAQADEASRLVDDLNKAAKAAEDARVVEKAPLDEAIAEIQGRYNLYIADRKNKTPGKVWKAVDALKACTKPFLDRLEDERKAAAALARLAAEEAQRIASEAARAAQASDLAAQDAAEELVLAAKRAEATARQIEASRPQARGGDRAMGLTKTFTAVLTDRKAALLHYLVARPDDITACLQRFADEDVRAKKYSIPGFNIVEGTKL